MNTSQIQSRVRTSLDLANGSRRTRTISYSQAIQAVREALVDGWGYVAGDTVANSYGYAAVRTVVFSACSPDRGLVRISVSVRRATRSSGVFPFSKMTRGSRPEKIQAAAESWVTGPCGPDDLVITRRQARALVLAQDREDAERALADVPADMLGSDIPVTVQDSIAAGNCQRETARVAAWFPGRESVPAGELLALLARRAPGLISFAVRAVRAAQGKLVTV